MSNSEINNFFDSKNISVGDCVRIDFKNRQHLFGFFIKAGDFEELSAKNFWRIVLKENANKWEATHQLDFAKIFNGSAITRLSISK